MVCSISGLEMFPKLVSELAYLIGAPIACCIVVSTVLCHSIVAFVGVIVHEPSCVMRLYKHMSAVL